MCVGRASATLDPAVQAYAFEYAPDWVRTGPSLAPLHLPNRPGVFSFPALSPTTYQRLPPLLADAQNRSETQLRQAQEKADALQADAERKHAEIMGTINQQRTVLEGRLEQLRTFEREYRTRLKTYLESQLEELGQRGSAAPVDSSGEAGYTQFTFLFDAKPCTRTMGSPSPSSR